MDFIPSGTLWDVLLSSPSGKLPEPDVLYWSAGMVSALGWMSERGWAHRDLKPHNFLVHPGDDHTGGRPRVFLTDFGTAAEALPVDQTKGGERRLPREACLWPVGTPDYIAPEVLEAHEDALVRAEEEEAGDDEEEERMEEEEGYGIQVDWWSLGVIV